MRLTALRNLCRLSSPTGEKPLHAPDDCGASGTEIISFSSSQTRQGWLCSAEPQISDAAVNDVSSSRKKLGAQCSPGLAGVPFHLGSDSTLSDLGCAQV